MTGRSLQELLNREIDGENGPEESAALAGLIESRPEVRAAHDRLRNLAQSLKSLEHFDPPHGLDAEILRRVRQRERPRPRREPWAAALRWVGTARPELRHALTFAAGLALGAFLVSLADQSSLLSRQDRSGFSGTLLPEGRLRQLQTIDRDEFNVNGVHGEAVSKLANGLILLELRLRSQAALEVVVEFDPSVFSLRSFEQSGVSAKEVAAAPGRLRLDHAGEGRYLVLLAVSRPVPSPLRFKLNGDNVRFERTLETRREGS